MATKNEKYALQAQSALGLPKISADRPTGASAALPPALDPREEVNDSFSILHIDDIEVYEHNPRTGQNPKYEELKASMIANGLNGTLTVTRRPGTLKYHPYEGGNTRLSIAKELYAAGVNSYGKVKVVIKAWTGDANVISAHLGENENRGDISFWEKAQGVAGFKAATETEQKRVLTTSDLSRALKANGVTFNLKLLQNFAFAIEHLAPVGPWLRATEVNDVLRPALGGAMAVADRLDVSAGTIKQAIEPVLNRHAVDLKATEQRNDEIDPAERVTPTLETADLVMEVQSAIAGALKLPVERLQLMVSALDANSRLTKEALLGIQLRSEAPAKGHAQQPSGNTGGPDLQRPLQGMLAAMPARQQHEPAGGVSGTTQTGQQGPSQGHSGPGSTSVHAGASVAPAAPASPTALFDELLALLTTIAPMVGLQESIISAPQMPFGFMMDFPPQLPNLSPERLMVMRATWKFLASLSYQITAAWQPAIPEGPLWHDVAAQGLEAFRSHYSHAIGGITAEDGTPMMGLWEVGTLFVQPELTPSLTRLLICMERIRSQYPERFIPPTPTPR